MTFPPPPYDPGQQPPPPPQPYMPVPPGYPMMPPPMPPTPPANNTKKIVAIALSIVGVFLVLCCGGVTFAVVHRQASDKPRVALGPFPGLTSKPATTPSAQAVEQFDLKPGTVATLDAVTGTEKVTVKSVKAYKKACRDYAPEPKKGMFAVVDVQVEATDGFVSVNPLYFTWVAPDGTTSDSFSGALSGCAKSDLSSTNSLRAGQKRAGQIVYDVTSTKGSVELVGGLLDETGASWKF